MVPRDLLTAPRCAPSYKPHVSEWSEIRLWMREPISLSREVLLAQNRQDQHKKRVTADGTPSDAACKGEYCGAVAVRERVIQLFVARY